MGNGRSQCTQPSTMAPAPCPLAPLHAQALSSPDQHEARARQKITQAAASDWGPTDRGRRRCAET